MTVRETETLLPADVDTVSVQPVVKDTVVPASSDTVSAVVTPVEQPKELTLKEIEELRKYIIETKDIEKSHMQLIISSYKFRLV